MHPLYLTTLWIWRHSICNENVTEDPCNSLGVLNLLLVSLSDKTSSSIQGGIKMHEGGQGGRGEDVRGGTNCSLTPLPFSNNWPLFVGGWKG